MNHRFFNILTLVASCALFATACGEDTSSFETPNTSNTPTNDNTISQKNFTLLCSPCDPTYFDLATNSYTAVTSEISVQIGDNDNRVITGARTIFFRTEWGLIDPSCTTEDGGCSVTWRSGSPDDMPADFRNNIIAYSPNGQETFLDLDGNGLFNDGDTFEDLEEPYLDINESGVFELGDLIIDTINGIDLTGADTSHNIGDGLYNGPNCAHTSLCSTTLASITVWEDGTLWLIGTPTFYAIGGTVTGLTGTLVLQNNAGDDLTITANGAFIFGTPIIGGLNYNVTVLDDGAQTCTVTNAFGTATADVTNVAVNCI